MREIAAFLIKLAGLAILLGTATVGAAQSPIASSEFFVTASDGVAIHVHRKAAAQPSKVPVLLIHGTWGDGRIWDFPGRSVMDYLASRGYDVYALDLRGMGSSDHPAIYSSIHVMNRVQDAVAVASYIVANTGRAPVVIGWSQGGVITGLFAATAPQLVAGVGLFSVPGKVFSFRLSSCRYYRAL